VEQAQRKEQIMDIRTATDELINLEQCMEIPTPDQIEAISFFIKLGNRVHSIEIANIILQQSNIGRFASNELADKIFKYLVGGA